MSDMAPDAISFEDELVFDEEVPLAPPPPPPPPSAPAPLAPPPPPLAPAAKSRRGSRKGTEPDAPEAEAGPALAPPASDAPVPPPSPETPTTAAAAAAPRDKRQTLHAAALGLALLSTTMSLGGLITVSRTVAAAQAERAEMRDQRAQLKHLTETLGAIDRALAARAPQPGSVAGPSPASGALSPDEFHRGLDGLRLALDTREPGGMATVNASLRAGLGEIAARLDRLEGAVAANRQPSGPHGR